MKPRYEAMMGLMGMMMALSEPEPKGRIFIEKGSRDETAALDNYKDVLKQRDGVKEYFINGKTVLARSYKNALKKANR